MACPLEREHSVYRPRSIVHEHFGTVFIARDARNLFRRHSTMVAHCSQFGHEREPVHVAGKQVAKTVRCSHFTPVILEMHAADAVARRQELLLSPDEIFL
jgi:hypothetical protein